MWFTQTTDWISNDCLVIFHSTKIFVIVVVVMALIMLLLLLLLLMLLIWHRFGIQSEMSIRHELRGRTGYFFCFCVFLSEKQQPQQPKSAPDDLHICERGRERISWFLELKFKIGSVENVFRFPSPDFYQWRLTETADKLNDYRMFFFKFVLH